MGRTTSSPPAGVSSRPRSSAAGEVGLDLERLLAEAAVDAADAELGGAVAGGDQRLEPGQERLEVDVPDPGDILAVGGRVVQGEQQERGRAALLERPHDLVGTGRILDQQQQDRLVSGRDPLEPPEGRAEAREALADLVQRRTERLCERGCADRVVDVVEARERQFDPRRALGSDEVEGRAAEPVQLDRPRANLQLGPSVSARRATVVAEVPDIRRGELVRVPARDAVARIGCVLQRGAGVAGVVEAVGDRSDPPAREVADLRVVAVDDEHCLGGQLRRSGAPALGDVLELAVAVELVAGEVSEQHCAGADAADDLRQRALVDLQQPELGVPLCEQGGRDARDEVRARPVPGESSAAADDLRHHRRGRRLAVRRRDDGRSLRQPRRQRVDRARIELPEQLAGNRRAAAGAGQA